MMLLQIVRPSPVPPSPSARRLKNGAEDAPDFFGRDALAGVGHFQQRPLTVYPGKDMKLTAARHRVVGILDKIEHDHAQVAVVSQDARRTGIQIDGLHDAMALGIEFEQLYRVADCRVERDDLGLLLRQAGQQQQSLGYTGTAIDLGIHHFQVGSDARLTCSSTAQIAQQAIDGQAHGAQRIVYFMGYPRRQQAKLGQTLLLRMARDGRESLVDSTIRRSRPSRPGNSTTTACTSTGRSLPIAVLW